MPVAVETIEGFTWGEQGAPNHFYIHTKEKWIAGIHLNAELTLGRQHDIMREITRNLVQLHKTLPVYGESNQ